MTSEDGLDVSVWIADNWDRRQEMLEKYFDICDTFPEPERSKVVLSERGRIEIMRAAIIVVENSK